MNNLIFYRAVSAPCDPSVLSTIFTNHHSKHRDTGDGDQQAALLYVLVSIEHSIGLRGIKKLELGGGVKIK